MKLNKAELTYAATYCVTLKSLAEGFGFAVDYTCAPLTDAVYTFRLVSCHHRPETAEPLAYTVTLKKRAVLANTRNDKDANATAAKLAAVRDMFDLFQVAARVICGLDSV